MAATSDPPLLRDGAPELELVPAIGGSMAALRWRGIDLVRRLSEAPK